MLRVRVCVRASLRAYEPVFTSCRPRGESSTTGSHHRPRYQDMQTRSVITRGCISLVCQHHVTPASAAGRSQAQLLTRSHTSHTGARERCRRVVRTRFQSREFSLFIYITKDLRVRQVTCASFVPYLLTGSKCLSLYFLVNFL